jgi:hypothetical protein
MKLGLKVLVISLVVALAAVPAAYAKNGGHGGGKPSWAGGGGKPSWAGSGKPSWAGSGHTSTNAPHEQKPEKDKAKHQEAGSAPDDGTQFDGSDLDGLNPAKYCKSLRDQMTQLELDFAAMFGLNPNHANAFGKCVSRRAHGEDLSGAVGGDEQQGEDNPCDASGTTTSTDSGTETGSDEEATDPEECSGDDSESGGPAEDEQGQNDDEQGEDQGDDGGDSSDEGDSSDLGTALSFLRL